MFSPIAFFSGVKDIIDPDAQAFLTATGITNETIIDAIDALVIGLKTDNLWSKMAALYPFVGGTDTTHKFNLKDPRDLDAAYRITWSGTITHNSNGVQGNGSDGFGNTHFIDNAGWTRTSRHVSIYSRTNSFGNMNSLGVMAPSQDPCHVYLKFSSSNDAYFRLPHPGGPIATITDTTGFFVGSKTSGTLNTKAYRNGSQVGSDQTQNTTQDSSLKHYILAQNNNGTAANFSSRNYCFFSFGQFLTATDVTNFNTIVQSFQTTLGRNV